MDKNALKAWRLSREKRISLPSGLTVTVRKVELLDMVASGKVPAPLLAELQEVGGQSDDLIQTGMDKLVDVMPMIDEVVLAAIIEPPIAAAADDEHLGLDELTTSDKLVVFNWTQGGVAAVTPFRAGTGEFVAAAQPGDGVRDEAEPDSGDRGELVGVPDGPGDADGGPGRGEEAERQVATGQGAGAGAIEGRGVPVGEAVCDEADEGAG